MYPRPDMSHSQSPRTRPGGDSIAASKPEQGSVLDRAEAQGVLQQPTLPATQALQMRAPPGTSASQAGACTPRCDPNWGYNDGLI